MNAAQLAPPAAPVAQLIDDLTVATRLGIAALAGLAVGIEREWSGHASGPEARFAGVRTFLLLGLIGGAAGWFMAMDWVVLAGVTLGSGVLMTIAAYWQATAHPGASRDGTSEVAALTVLVIGVAAGLGYLVLAGGCVAVVTLVLGEKKAIHGFVRRIDEREMHAALVFAVLALAVLPVLPVGPVDPWGTVRPRLLWSVVILFSGLNFIGYIARHAVGHARGIPIAGLVGGILSSTAVTIDFARQSRREPALHRAFALGVTGACTVLLLRTVVASLALHYPVAIALSPYVIAPLVLGIAVVAPTLRRSTDESTYAPPDVPNPLGLRSAIPMAIGLQLVLTGFHFLRARVGTQAVLPSAALLGFADVDALTFSMTQFARSSGLVGLAARAIVIGILANTVLKIAIAAILGTPAFARGVAWRLALQGVLLGGALIAAAAFVTR